MARLEFAYNSVENKLESEDIQIAVIKSLAYSEIFSYPLNIEEIFRTLELGLTDKNLLIPELEDLITKKLVFRLGEFYSLKEDYLRLKLRLERNHRAEKYMSLAKIISRFIGSFPFVRAVFISGSLSKNSMNKDSDIDYFVITESGRLWFSRTILILFKKIFLFNSSKLFCLNYFIDKDHLEIQDRDIYVSHEILTLVPTYGKQHCKSFFNNNKWVLDYFPNATYDDCTNVPELKIQGQKWFLEKILKNRLGDFIEMKFIDLSKKYWKRKFGNLVANKINEKSISLHHISAHNHANFKQGVLDRYQREIEILKEHLQFDLS